MHSNTFEVIYACGFGSKAIDGVLVLWIRIALTICTGRDDTTAVAVDKEPAVDLRGKTLGFMFGQSLRQLTWHGPYFSIRGNAARTFVAAIGGGCFVRDFLPFWTSKLFLKLRST